jgi:hypothetical protein
MKKLCLLGFLCVLFVTGCVITPGKKVHFSNAAQSNPITSTKAGPIVTVVNYTGKTISGVYLSQTATDDWEDNVLHFESLMDGESIHVVLDYPLTVTNRYDIRLEDVYGGMYTKWDVLITPNASIEFTQKDLDSEVKENAK